MNGREIEARTCIWAVAEVFWQDDDGAAHRVSATLEDTSISGACLRVKHPFSVGSRLTVKWHREQFSAIARNCRKDGRDFLLGVLRDVGDGIPKPSLGQNLPSLFAGVKKEISHLPAVGNASPSVPLAAAASGAIAPASALPPQPAPHDASAVQAAQRRFPPRPAERSLSERSPSERDRGESVSDSAPRPGARIPFQMPGPPSRHERKVMEHKTLFPKFWRRQQDGDATNPAKSTEAPVNKPAPSPAPAPAGVRGELLSYEDIYHAAGLMNPRSGYGIHKVFDMLNSDRIRDLAVDVKRASVLMALDAAGTSIGDLLQDATRRHQALQSYEEGRQKQLEEFERRKAQENSQIEAEMERMRAHYAERIQHNLDEVKDEKEALRNWQAAMQTETQRINEVIELCGKQPAASAAAAGAGPGAAPGTRSSSEPAPADKNALAPKP